MMTYKRISGRRERKLFLLCVIGALIVGALLLIVNTRPAAAEVNASPFVNVYPIPTANSEPTNIISLGAGQVWYTMQNAGAIGKLTVSGGGQATFQKFDTPTANSGPFDLTYDGQYIWFTERLANKIGRLNPANGNITEYAIPTANSEPMGIAVAPNGHVWFVERQGNKIARFKPASSTFDEYPLPKAGALPYDVATSANDSIWLTAPGVKFVYHFLPEKIASQQFEVVPVVQVIGTPPFPLFVGDTIAVSGDEPWITMPTEDIVARYHAGTLGFWLPYSLANEGTQVSGIFLQRSADKFQTWFTEPAGGRAGLLVSHRFNNNAITAYETPLPGANPRPTSIVADANGTAWIAAPGANAIMAWRQPYFFQTQLPFTIAP